MHLKKKIQTQQTICGTMSGIVSINQLQTKHWRSFISMHRFFFLIFVYIILCWSIKKTSETSSMNHCSNTPWNLHLCKRTRWSKRLAIPMIETPCHTFLPRHNWKRFGIFGLRHDRGDQPGGTYWSSIGSQVLDLAAHPERSGQWEALR